MHEKKSQFILLKIPPHVVRLLGKIHALSIEVLCVLSMCFNVYIFDLWTLVHALFRAILLYIYSKRKS